MSKNVKRFRELEFWAENGYVYVVHLKRAENVDTKDVDQINKCFIGLSPKEFLKRAITVGLYVDKFYDKYASIAKEVKQFLQDAHEVYKKAMENQKEERKIQLYIPVPTFSSTPKDFKPKVEEGDPLVNLIVHGFEYVRE